MTPGPLALQYMKQKKMGVYFIEHFLKDVIFCKLCFEFLKS